MQASNAKLPTTETGSESERSTLLITYVLHALAPFTAVSAIVAVIISHIKVNETESAFIRSHHSWLIGTFWWGLLWFAVSSVLVFVLIGFLGYAIVGLWWLYRTVRGFINYKEKRPMPG